jgi:POT family proton-dependent oligopeptide transporter
MPASYFQSFNPVMLVCLTPIFTALWGALDKRGLEPSSPMKQAIGLLLLAVGYVVIAFGVKDLDPNVKVSMLWLTSLYMLHTMGEICLSPIGLSMVNKLSPARFSSLMMGVWYMSTAAANKFAGMLSSYYPEEGVDKHLLGYHVADLFDFFMLFAIMSAVAAVILFCLTGILKKMMHGVE